MFLMADAICVAFPEISRYVCTSMYYMLMTFVRPRDLDL